jgi:hypothetical protein
MKRYRLKHSNFEIKKKMSKENNPLDKHENGNDFIATMQLRWIKHTEANDPRLGVKFANDIGWGWPDNIVLQQKWISNEGNEKWEDVELFKQP